MTGEQRLRHTVTIEPRLPPTMTGEQRLRHTVTIEPRLTATVTAERLPQPCQPSAANLDPPATGTGYLSKRPNARLVHVSRAMLVGMRG